VDPDAPDLKDHRGRRAVFFILLFAVVSFVLVVLSIQRSMLFPRGFTVPLEDGGANVPGLVRLEVESADGPVEAYFLPGDGVDTSSPGPVVVFAHGNAELIDHWTSEMAPYRRMGVSVFLPEYRGYGRSAGSPSEKAIRSDFVEFHQRLVARPDVDASRIVFHGRSLGGGAVCSLANEHPPRAMILQSTFESVPAIAKRYLVPRFLILDPFDNLRTVERFDGKVLVIHGRRDITIPFSHGRTLATAARDGRLVAYESDHNQWPPSDDPSDYWEELRRFLVEAEIISGI